jgi:REP-associated tyrosine transposase
VTQIDVLRDAVRQVRARAPFHIDAWVVLPDHMHCLPVDPCSSQGQAIAGRGRRFPGRWRAIKKGFSKSVRVCEPRSPVMRLAGANAVSGSGDTGSTRSVTSRTSLLTSTMFISIR